MKEKIHLTSSIFAIVASICAIVAFIDSSTWTKIFGHKDKTGTTLEQSKPAIKEVSATKKDSLPTTDARPGNTVNTRDSIYEIKATPGMQRMPPEKSNFFITFFKTIAVFVAIIYSLIACLFVGFFELIAQVFGRDGFYTTKSIWNWAWHDIARDWYWVRAVNWQAYLSITIWFGILSGSSRN
jgi:hypothetical protein